MKDATPDHAGTHAMASFLVRLGDALSPNDENVFRVPIHGWL